jgi:hypothetical protein
MEDSRSAISRRADSYTDPLVAQVGCWAWLTNSLL